MKSSALATYPIDSTDVVFDSINQSNFTRDWQLFGVFKAFLLETIQNELNRRNMDYTVLPTVDPDRLGILIGSLNHHADQIIGGSPGGKIVTGADILIRIYSLNPLNVEYLKCRDWQFDHIKSDENKFLLHLDHLYG